MGVPKRKTSKMRLRTRKAANRWHAPKLSKMLAMRRRCLAAMSLALPAVTTKDARFSPSTPVNGRLCCSKWRHFILQ